MIKEVVMESLQSIFEQIRDSGGPDLLTLFEQAQSILVMFQRPCGSAAVGCLFGRINPGLVFVKNLLECYQTFALRPG